MRLRIFLIILFIIGGICFSSSFVFAQVGGNTAEIDELNKEIATRKDKIKQLEETLSTYKKTITQKQTEAQSLKNQLSILDNRVAQAQVDIVLTQAKIDEVQLQISALELSIADKEGSIAVQKKMLVAIVKNVNSADRKNYLEIMLTNENFADFYNQVKYLETVYADLGRSVKDLRLAKEDLNAKKLQASNQKMTYEQLKQELVDKQENLNDQANLKQNLFIKTKSDEARYRTLVDNLTKQYQAIENETRAYEAQVRKKLEQQDKISESGTTVLSWPVANRYITSAFHDPDYPYRNVFEHNAVDIRASQGTSVRAAAAGYVARAKRCSASSCYSYLLLVHTGEISTVYGHLSSILVNEDQFVGKGDIIGYSGGTPGTVGAGPFVTGPHLHFEVRLNGIPVDPIVYLGD